MNATANLRVDPGMKGRVVRVLRRGERVEVTGAESGWAHVRTGAGEQGWVKSELVTRDVATAAVKTAPAKLTFLTFPVNLEATRPAVSVLASIFCLLFYVIVAGVAGSAAGLEPKFALELGVICGLVCFVATPSGAREGLFFIYTLVITLGVGAAGAFSLGGAVSRGDQSAWLPGVGVPVFLLLYGIFSGATGWLLLAIAGNCWGLFSGMNDLLHAAEDNLPGASAWGPIIGASAIFAIFAEFYMQTAWTPWPFAQCAVAMLAFFAGAME